MQTFEILCKRLKKLKNNLDEINTDLTGIGIVTCVHLKIKIRLPKEALAIFVGAKMEVTQPINAVYDFKELLNLGIME
jgi:hypothetical protein